MRNILILQEKENSCFDSFFELAILMISEYSQKRNLVVKIQDIGPLDPASPPPKSTGKCEKKKIIIHFRFCFLFFQFLGLVFQRRLKKRLGILGISTIGRQKRMIGRGE